MNASQIRLGKVELHHALAPLEDIEGAVARELQGLRDAVHPGMRIAVTVGSRGIQNIALIVRCVVDFLRQCGAEPFIIPAMGSHGGATAQGQTAVLHSYGVTEETVHAPIRATMEVVRIGQTEGEPAIPVFMDRYAWEADGVVAVNRVKPHTDFHGPHESGIVKMLTIGLGKHRQAMEMHQYGAQGLRDYIQRVSREVIRSGKILGALGIVEDGHDNTSRVALARGEDIFTLDAQMLEQARQSMARLPFTDLDLLIIDCMGKNFSGTGLDTNVIGRLCIRGQADGTPNCRRIVTLDLSEESHGNALGIGLSDVVTRRLVDKVDWQATLENVLTSGFLERGFVPIVQNTDREAVNAALRGLGRKVGPDQARIVRIPNTLDLQYAWVSPALLQELAQKDPSAGEAAVQPLTFDEAGRIMPF